VDVAAGDLDGDGRAEIVVGAGTGGEVRVFDAYGNLHARFTAYSANPGYTGGVRVAVGDVDGDGEVEIVTGPTQVRPVDVSIFTGDGRPRGTFRVNTDFRNGIYVAVPPALGPRLELIVPEGRAVEGRDLHLTASLVDRAGGSKPDKFAATVNWGGNNESTATVSALGDGRYRLDATRRYVQYGRYTVTVRVADTSLRGALGVTVAKVADAPLVAHGRAIRTRGPTFNGLIAVIQDRDRDGTVLDLSARVLWGDGARSNARIVDSGAGRFRILGRHTYARAGSYRVLVQVRSTGGSRASARSSVRVSRP
jgi:FG-GAP-like repeat